MAWKKHVMAFLQVRGRNHALRHVDELQWTPK
jgi:hypothetical protein